MDVSRRRFLRNGLAVGVALMAATHESASQANPLNGERIGSRDVVAVLNMIRLNLFGEVMHCVGGPKHLESIELFLGIHHTDQFTRIVKVESAGITITHLRTAKNKTVTIYDDRRADRPYAGMFRVEGTRGIWMQDWNKIHLRGISPPDTWEDFGVYREAFVTGHSSLVTRQKRLPCVGL